MLLMRVPEEGGYMLAASIPERVSLPVWMAPVGRRELAGGIEDGICAEIG